jgi:hypothetical protein
VLYSALGEEYKKQLKKFVDFYKKLDKLIPTELGVLPKYPVIE